MNADYKDLSESRLLVLGRCTTAWQLDFAIERLGFRFGNGFARRVPVQIPGDSRPGSV